MIYYNSPIDAACMIRWHGARLSCERDSCGILIGYDVDVTYQDAIDAAAFGVTCNKYIIKADEILLPRHGDLCRLGRAVNAFMVVNGNATIGCWLLEDLMNHIRDTGEECIIVQRNDKPFIWPERD